MGYNIAILGEREGLPGLHHNGSAVLELEECIHLHLEDLRLVFTKTELEQLVAIFAEAGKTFKELGSPERTEAHYTLGGQYMEGRRLQSDRMAVELTRDGTVHVHNKFLRIHMTQGDFWEFADMLEEAKASLVVRNTEEVFLKDCVFPTVHTEYLAWLDEYISAPEKANKCDVKEHKMRVMWYLRHLKGDETVEADLQRPDGVLPEGWRPGPVPEDINKRYLFSLYESIKDWGYASGPFYGEYMRAFPLEGGKWYLKGAHRAACLLKLNYDKITVSTVGPPSCWNSQGQ